MITISIFVDLKRFTISAFDNYDEVVVSFNRKTISLNLKEKQNKN